MSSATSIKGHVKPKPVAAEPSADDSFRPWHFFVLVSLAASTIAVVMARQSSPENLVLISATIAAAGFAAGALYRALAPLVADDAAAFSEPLTERLRATLEREKMLVLRAIKDLEFDRAMGKLSQKDFDEMSGRLRARAISLIQQLADGEAGYREIIERELSARLAGAKVPGARVKPDTDVRAAAEPAPVTPAVEVTGACAACGVGNDVDAVFCKRCGARLGASLTGVGEAR